MIVQVVDSDEQNVGRLWITSIVSKRCLCQHCDHRNDEQGLVDGRVHEKAQVASNRFSEF
jgi:hypothetical protein